MKQSRRGDRKNFIPTTFDLHELFSQSSTLDTWSGIIIIVLWASLCLLSVSISGNTLRRCCCCYWLVKSFFTTRRLRNKSMWGELRWTSCRSSKHNFPSESPRLGKVLWRTRSSFWSRFVINNNCARNDSDDDCCAKMFLAICRFTHWTETDPWEFPTQISFSLSQFGQRRAAEKPQTMRNAIQNAEFIARIPCSVTRSADHICVSIDDNIFGFQFSSSWRLVCLLLGPLHHISHRIRSDVVWRCTCWIWEILINSFRGSQMRN